MKISFKLTAIMVALGLFAIASVSINLIIRSQDSIIDLSEKYAESMANHSAANIDTFLELYLAKVETTANVMEQYRDIALANRRNIFNIIIEGMVEENPKIIGAWCVWEPDVLEGNDQQYIGTKGTGSSGRFSPYYYWDGGIIKLNVREDYNSSNYYLLARNSGNPTILDPFENNVGGKKIFMTSISVPIRADGKTVGVVGFDIPLTEIQEISQNRPDTCPSCPLRFP